MDTIGKTQALAEEALAFYRGHFQQLFTTAAVVLLPIALLGFLADVYLAGGMGQASTPAGALASLAATLAVVCFQLLIVLPLSIVGGILAQGALDCQLRAIAEKRDLPSATQAWKRLLPKLVPLLLTSGLVAVMAGIGMFLFLIPGLWVLYRGMMIAQVVVHEGTTGLSAFGRSGELMKKAGGEFWLALAVFILANLLGSSLLAAILPQLLAGFAIALLRVALLPLPLILVWLTYRNVVSEAAQPHPGGMQTA